MSQFANIQQSRLEAGVITAKRAKRWQLSLSAHLEMVSSIWDLLHGSADKGPGDNAITPHTLHLNQNLKPL